MHRPPWERLILRTSVLWVLAAFLIFLLCQGSRSSQLQQCEKPPLAVPDCANCSAGFACNGSACLQCDTGYYQPLVGQDSECLPCEGGNYSKSCNSSVCERCPPGHFTPLDVRPHVSCYQCPPGKNQPKSGKASCFDCPKAQMCNKTGCTECDKCPPGWQADNNRTFCLPCLEGFELVEGECRPCKAGTYCNKTACTECTRCPPGFMSPTIGKRFCRPCSKGHYADRSGMSICPMCKDGWYANDLHMTGCIECPRDYYCPEKENDPVPCEDGAFCPPGSMQPRYCPALYKINNAHDGCVMGGSLIIIVCITVLVNVLIMVGLSIFCYMRRRPYQETTPLIYRKETCSQDPPVYDGL